MVDRKVIKDYVDSSNDDNFEFVLRVSRDFLEQSDEDIIEVLRLKKTLSENFTCTDENNTIIEFKDDAELGAVADVLLQRGQSFQSITADSNLDNLNRKYKVPFCMVLQCTKCRKKSTVTNSIRCES